MFKPESLDDLQERHPVEWSILHERLGRAPIHDAGYRYHQNEASHPLHKIVRPADRHWSDTQEQFVDWLETLSSLQIAGHARGRVAVVQIDIEKMLQEPLNKWPLDLLGISSPAPKLK